MSSFLALYTGLLFITALAAFFLAIYAWRRQGSNRSTGFVALTLAAAVWSGGYALELMSTRLPDVIFWAKLEYLGIATLPVAWLVFALQYTDRVRWLQSRFLVGLTVIPLLTVLMVFSNEAHGLVWREVSLVEGPAGSRLFAPSYGPWFWLQWIYAYLCLLVGTVLLLGAAGRFSPLYRQQTLALLAGIATPWVGNLLYIVGVSPIDLTPLAFSVAALWLGWAVFRFRLLDIVPVAYSQVFSSIAEGVVVLDLHDRIIDANPAAERIIGRPLSELFGQPAATLPGARPELVERFADKREGRAEVSLGEPAHERHYDLRVSPLLDRYGRYAGRLVMVHDITDRVRARRRLLTQYAVTRALAEANTIAEVAPKILHDVCQHLAWEQAEFWLVVGADGLLRRLASWPEGTSVQPETVTSDEELPRQVWYKSVPVINPLADGFVAGFPVAIGNKMLAVLTFLSRTADPADESLWQTTQDIGDQVSQFIVRAQAEEQVQWQNDYLAAIALENAGLYQAAQDELAERKRAESRQAVFAGLAQALNAITTAEEAARVIVNAADRLMGWDACALNLYVPGQDRLYHILAIDTIDGERQEVPAGSASDDPSPTARRVFTEGPQLILRQVAQSSADFTAFGDKSRPSASLMFVPIRDGPQVSGLLTIQSYTANAYTGEDLATLQALADHASGALNRIRATDELRAQKQLFESLVMVARALVEQPDLEASLQNALVVATELTAARRGDLFLLDEAGLVTHKLVTGRNDTPESISLVEQAVRGGLAGWVVRQREAALIADVEEDPRWLPLPGNAEPARSALCVPILGQQAILGVLTLLHPSPNHFTREQFHLMLAASEQMSLALENARQHSQLMALVASSRDGIALFNLNGRLLVLNPAAVTMLGLPGDTAGWINQPLANMLLSLRRSAPALVRIALSQLRHSFSQPESTAEGEFELPTGVTHWFMLPIQMGDVPFGRLLILRDVTEERMLNKLRLDLMQTLVHDLRNPLNAIFGAVELLLYTDDMAAPTQRQMIEIIQQNSARMADLINTIMDISRLESRQMPLELEAVDLGLVVAETFHLQLPLLDARQLQTECLMSPDLPAAWGDARLIGRMLQNLVGNAIKFTGDGGHIRVLVEQVESADGLPALLVRVEDNGPGIPAEIRSRLFQKFVTGSQTGRGSGLGLAFCRLAVEAQGGRIWAESEVGKGTTMVFTLPVAEANAQ